VLKKYGLTLLVTLSFAVSSHAQRLQFDFELKGGGGPINVAGADDNPDSNLDHAEIYPIQAGLHLAITQHLAIGGFYSRSIAGSVHYQTNSNSSSGSNQKYDANLQSLMYGFDLRLSSGRAAKWRPYLSASFGKAEFVQEASEKQPYRLAASSTLIALNGGMLLRFGHNFYWNVFEVSGKYLPYRIFWLDSDLCIEFKTGFLYHIRLKSK
jgi:hypothetical protein